MMTSMLQLAGFALPTSSPATAISKNGARLGFRSLSPSFGATAISSVLARLGLRRFGSVDRRAGWGSSSARPKRSRLLPCFYAALHTLDLTEDNVRLVLVDARSEFAQIFDTSVGMTGEADLAELDGPFVKIRLKGRFWHERSLVLARLATYLKSRIPEILEVDIEDEKQLDDSPENF